MSDDVKILSEYLQAETDQNEKSFKLGIILFTVLTLVIVGYFWAIRVMIGELITPESITTIAVQVVDDNLPVAQDSIEGSIKGVIPDVVKFTMDAVIDKSVPTMRGKAERYLSDHAGSLAMYTSDVTGDAFVSILKKNRDTFKPDEVPTKQAIVASLKASMKIELAADLQTRLEESADSPDGESAAHKLHKSAAALRNINAKLNSLAAMDEGGDRKTKMNKKIVGAWWGWLRNSRVGN